MKIEQNLQSLSSTPAIDKKRANSTSTPTAGNKGAAGDSVQLTSLSSQLQSLEKNLGNVSTVDSSRVEAIKQAISEGRFQVDAEAVANSLIKTAKEFLA